MSTVRPQQPNPKFSKQLSPCARQLGTGQYLVKRSQMNVRDQTMTQTTLKHNAEKHNAEKHNVEKHNAEKHNVEKHNAE